MSISPKCGTITQTFRLAVMLATAVVLVITICCGWGHEVLADPVVGELAQTPQQGGGTVPDVGGRERIIPFETRQNILLIIGDDIGVEMVRPFVDELGLTAAFPSYAPNLTW